MPDLISVIIPTFNRAALLSRALQSVAEQDYLNLEVIVVDDGGSDGTPQVVEQFKRHFKESGIELVFLRQENAGPAKARNLALQKSQGGLVAFLDSDDLWRPTFCSTLLALLHRFPSAALAFCSMDVIDAEDRIWTHRPTGLPSEPPTGLLTRPFERIVEYMPMGTPAVMMRRDVAVEMNFFDTSYRIGEDWDLWYRVARQHDFAYTNEPLTLCREHPHNMPKEDAAAWADRVRLSVRHLPMVMGPKARPILIDRISTETLLYLEQALREGKGLPDRGILDEVRVHGLAPHALRFGIACMLLKGPGWLGRLYANSIRAIGNCRRKKKS